ncbi:hypothetical protein D1007_44291 [Hordeum vulgare]|uniref:Predicted protein n=1 Tax=Hordeum vulgare subsp. vulgare TaxID=112509 RepID=F2DKH2_HORVV|nr:uncharacterized protein LOC123410211 [Hordeum vulgare subsp. vulgare]KAE8782331.1 hypothetical protein D1007_44291 [Hordeum vulgare]KAI4975378.1 hypothetical protein ZWY2020_048985 [Hordeum vulgare]BAJ95593.1 predicted protein [Hordeum vulgare subsp. vulgare]
MGRGRGRGRKPIANGRSHEDKVSSGEEVVPARKRRGRPQKQRVPDKVDLPPEPKSSAAGVHGDAEGGNAELKENDPEGNGNKRNRAPKEESSNLDMEENSSSTRSSNDESTTTTRSSGFRQNGSRRKSTPRRAAEAGL